MRYRTKTNEVADGCLVFLRALTNDHHADELAVCELLIEKLTIKVNVLKSSNPARNR